MYVCMYTIYIYANIQIVDALLKLLVNIFEFIVFRLSKVYNTILFCSQFKVWFGLVWIVCFCVVCVCVWHAFRVHYLDGWMGVYQYFWRIKNNKTQKATQHSQLYIMYNPRNRDRDNSNKLSFVLMFLESHFCSSQSMEICSNLCAIIYDSTSYTFFQQCSSNRNVYIEYGIIFLYENKSK